MTPLPDKNLKPEEVDQIIKDHARPIDQDRKDKLMSKLKNERKKFDAKQRISPSLDRDTPSRER